MSDYLNLTYVTLGFLAQIMVMVYVRSAQDVKENWPLYRCNPPYWIFSDDISQDFNYCVQTTQMNMMGYLLQPMNYMVGSLASMNGELGSSLNGVREMISGIRGFVSNIIESVFGVFLNLVVEFQKMVISIKDLVGKIIGIMVTFMFILDGSLKTMQSSWSGPPGQLVKAIGSCFHPTTLVQLADGSVCEMQKLPLGAVLADGGRVFSVMRIANMQNELLYEMKGGVGGVSVYVTGSHFVFDEVSQRWCPVRDHPKAVLTTICLDEFTCLITTNRRIPIGDFVFWDWEDDELNEMWNGGKKEDDESGV